MLGRMGLQLVSSPILHMMVLRVQIVKRFLNGFFFFFLK